MRDVLMHFLFCTLLINPRPYLRSYKSQWYQLFSECASFSQRKMLKRYNALVGIALHSTLCRLSLQSCRSAPWRRKLLPAWAVASVCHSSARRWWRLCTARKEAWIFGTLLSMTTLPQKTSATSMKTLRGVHLQSTCFETIWMEKVPAHSLQWGQCCSTSGLGWLQNYSIWMTHRKKSAERHVPGFGFCWQESIMRHRVSKIVLI